MKVTALAAHTPEAVRAALAARGWEAQPAWFAATGIQPLVILIEDITESEREALVHWGTKSGADVLTGSGWALVAAAASRIAPLARYDRAPAELAGLAPVLGRVLATRADLATAATLTTWSRSFAATATSASTSPIRSAISAPSG